MLELQWPKIYNFPIAQDQAWKFGHTQRIEKLIIFSHKIGFQFEKN